MADKHTPKEEPVMSGADETKPEVIGHETIETTTLTDTPKEAASEKAGAGDTRGDMRSPKKSRFTWLRTKKGKITLASVAGVILLVTVLLLIPTTRYGILGSFIRKDLALSIIDSKTGKPVSDAEVNIPGTTGHTNNEGKAKLSNVPVGEYKVSVKKKNYKDMTVSVTVPILASADVGQLKLEATGRQVPISIKNKITGQPLGNATITAGEATAITDTKGEVTLVVPASATIVKATVKADKYNEQQVDITVTEQKDAKNDFAITPAGKVYFLSKRTGKINVMKSDLDGTNAQVVVQGTGKEEESGTVLLASRDWKYLLLKSRRDSDQPKLYLITTSNDKLDVVDEGNADFNLVGWRDHRFVYSVYRRDVKDGQPRQSALKSYDADVAKITLLDETNGVISGGAGKGEVFSNIFIIDTQNTIVYVKSWFGSGVSANDQTSILAVQPDGKNKRTLKSFNPDIDYLQAALPYEANEIYFSFWNVAQNKNRYYEYEDGAIKENANIKESAFTQFYPTYLLSPSGEKTFWYEPRDGKNTLFIGNKLGEEGKEIATSSEYTPYGWYTDDYLLVSKGGSELYILAANNTDAKAALKVTDYHKPNIVYRGYGGGYGGGF